MTQLKEKLEGDQGIQTIALVGVGGAGKTTLARYYAQRQKANFVWEINAETWLSLTQSFEKMAYALCQTEEDHKLLRSLQAIQNTTEREEKIGSVANFR
jgi:shikimate kinase